MSALASITPTRTSPCSLSPRRTDRPTDASRPKPLRRPVRVWLLVLAICAMSLADLAMTLTYLTQVGMVESNPLARSIMLYNSPALLVAWKCATVGLGVTIICLARRTRIGELGAWIAAGILVLLTIHWTNYNAQAHTLTPYIGMMDQTHSSKWVAMVP